MSQQAGESSHTETGGTETAGWWWWWWSIPDHLGKWSEQSKTSFIEANRLLLSMFDDSQGDTVTEDEHVDSSLSGLASRHPEWTVDRSTDAAADLEMGDTITFTKELSDEDVHRFAESTGDTNRLHLDDSFAERTRFEGRIVHGSLLSGLISAALARLPGLPIYLSQDLEFGAPARPGETLTTVCEIVENVGEQTYRLRTSVSNEADEVLVDGEAIVLIDDLPEADEPASR